jgi:hypothetical protein
LPTSPPASSTRHPTETGAKEREALWQSTNFLERDNFSWNRRPALSPFEHHLRANSLLLPRGKLAREPTIWGRPESALALIVDSTRTSPHIRKGAKTRSRDVNCSAAVETAASYGNCWLVTVRHDNGYGRSIWACLGFSVATNAPRQILNYSSSSALDAASPYAAVFDGAMPETVSIESLNTHRMGRPS